VETAAAGLAAQVAQDRIGNRLGQLMLVEAAAAAFQVLLVELAVAVVAVQAQEIIQTL
jgi:hypothetical protein